MADHHSDGLDDIGRPPCLKGILCPKRDDLDENVERLKEALSSRGKRKREPGVQKGKKSL